MTHSMLQLKSQICSRRTKTELKGSEYLTLIRQVTRDANECCRLQPSADEFTESALKVLIYCNSSSVAVISCFRCPQLARNMLHQICEMRVAL